MSVKDAIPYESPEYEIIVEYDKENNSKEDEFTYYSLSPFSPRSKGQATHSGFNRRRSKSMEDIYAVPFRLHSSTASPRIATPTVQEELKSLFGPTPPIPEKMFDQENNKDLKSGSSFQKGRENLKNVTPLPLPPIETFLMRNENQFCRQTAVATTFESLKENIKSPMFVLDRDKYKIHFSDFLSDISENKSCLSNQASRLNVGLISEKSGVKRRSQNHDEQFEEASSDSKKVKPVGSLQEDRNFFPSTSSSTPLQKPSILTGSLCSTTRSPKLNHSESEERPDRRKRDSGRLSILQIKQLDSSPTFPRRRIKRRSSNLATTPGKGLTFGKKPAITSSLSKSSPRRVSFAKDVEEREVKGSMSRSSGGSRRLSRERGLSSAPDILDQSHERKAFETFMSSHSPIKEKTVSLKQESPGKVWSPTKQISNSHSQSKSLSQSQELKCKSPSKMYPKTFTHIQQLFSSSSKSSTSTVLFPDNNNLSNSGTVHVGESNGERSRPKEKCVYSLSPSKMVSKLKRNISSSSLFNENDDIDDNDAVLSSETMRKSIYLLDKPAPKSILKKNGGTRSCSQILSDIPLTSKGVFQQSLPPTHVGPTTRQVGRRILGPPLPNSRKTTATAISVNDNGSESRNVIKRPTFFESEAKGVSSLNTFNLNFPPNLMPKSNLCTESNSLDSKSKYKSDSNNVASSSSALKLKKFSFSSFEIGRPYYSSYQQDLENEQDILEYKSLNPHFKSVAGVDCHNYSNNNSTETPTVIVTDAITNRTDIEEVIGNSKSDNVYDKSTNDFDRINMVIDDTHKIKGNSDTQTQRFTVDIDSYKIVEKTTADIKPPNSYEVDIHSQNFNIKESTTAFQPAATVIQKNRTDSMSVNKYQTRQSDKSQNICIANDDDVFMGDEDQNHHSERNQITGLEFNERDSSSLFDFEKQTKESQNVPTCLSTEKLFNKNHSEFNERHDFLSRSCSTPEKKNSNASTCSENPVIKNYSRYDDRVNFPSKSKAKMEYEYNEQNVEVRDLINRTRGYRNNCKRMMESLLQSPVPTAHQKALNQNNACCDSRSQSQIQSSPIAATGFVDKIEDTNKDENDECYLQRLESMKASPKVEENDSWITARRSSLRKKNNKPPHSPSISGISDSTEAVNSFATYVDDEYVHQRTIIPTAIKEISGSVEDLLEDVTNSSQKNISTASNSSRLNVEGDDKGKHKQDKLSSSNNIKILQSPHSSQMESSTTTTVTKTYDYEVKSSNDNSCLILDYATNTGQNFNPESGKTVTAVTMSEISSSNRKSERKTSLNACMSCVEDIKKEDMKLLKKRDVDDSKNAPSLNNEFIAHSPQSLHNDSDEIKIDDVLISSASKTATPKPKPAIKPKPSIRLLRSVTSPRLKIDEHTIDNSFTKMKKHTSLVSKRDSSGMARKSTGLKTTPPVKGPKTNLNSSLGQKRDSLSRRSTSFKSTFVTAASKMSDATTSNAGKTNLIYTGSANLNRDSIGCRSALLRSKSTLVTATISTAATSITTHNSLREKSSINRRSPNPKRESIGLTRNSTLFRSNLSSSITKNFCKANSASGSTSNSNLETMGRHKPLNKTNTISPNISTNTSRTSRRSSLTPRKRRSGSVGVAGSKTQTPLSHTMSFAQRRKFFQEMEESTLSSPKNRAAVTSYKTTLSSSAATSRNFASENKPRPPAVRPKPLLSRIGSTPTMK